MINLSMMSNLQADPKLKAALNRSPLAGLLARPGLDGFMTAGAPAPAGGFDGLMAQAEESARQALAGAENSSPAAGLDLAGLKSAGLSSDMLAGLLNLEGVAGKGRSASLVERANLEAILSSGRFGNLLDIPARRAAGRDMGRISGQAEAPATPDGDGDGSPAAGLGMPQGLIRPPRRASLTRAPEAMRAAALQSVRESWLAAAGPDGGQAASTQPKAAAAEAEKTVAAAAAPPAGASPAKGKFSLEKLDELVGKVALALNMDPNLIKAVIKTESNFDQRAVSKAGAKGLMQLMPATARELGVKDVFNPVENVWAGARYLKKMLDRHGGNIKNALASYNWGPGNFDRQGSHRMPGETRRYISTVTQHYARFKRTGSEQA